MTYKCSELCCGKQKHTVFQQTYIQALLRQRNKEKDGFKDLSGVCKTYKVRSRKGMAQYCNTVGDQWIKGNTCLEETTGEVFSLQPCEANSCQDFTPLFCCAPAYLQFSMLPSAAACSSAFLFAGFP